MKRLTKAKPTECKVCQGMGYTAATCAEMMQVIGKDGRSHLRTAKQGSGCSNCLGTGQINRPT